LRTKPTGKGLAAIYRQEIIHDVTLFTSQGVASFYDKLFSALDFKLPRAKTGRTGFPKEALLCAFIVMKCESFVYITDLLDYLENNLLIAYYCGFDITKPLPSYWTLERFIKNLDNGVLKEIQASLVRILYKLGVVDASFIGLDSTPVLANTSQNNPKSFAKNKYSNENHPKSDPGCALGVHSASNQHNERNYEFYWGYKNHILVDCISGLPIYELTTTADIADSTMVETVLQGANEVIPIEECTFLTSSFETGIVTLAFCPKRVDTLKVEAVPVNGKPVIVRNGFVFGAPPVFLAIVPVLVAARTFAGFRVSEWAAVFLTQAAFASRLSVLSHGKAGFTDRIAGSKVHCFPGVAFVQRDGRFAVVDVPNRVVNVLGVIPFVADERLWVRNGNSAANLNTISHISALAVALASVLAGNRHSYRSLKLLRRAG